MIDDFGDFLDPLDIVKKRTVFIPINNAETTITVGGSHWSILVYSQASAGFYYFDSL